MTENLLKTEMRNPASMHMDKMSSEEMARLVICANYDAVAAVERAAADIARAIDAIAHSLENGGIRWRLTRGRKLRPFDRDRSSANLLMLSKVL